MQRLNQLLQSMHIYNIQNTLRRLLVGGPEATEHNGQCCYLSRNIASVTPTIIYSYYQKYRYEIKKTEKTNKLNFGKKSSLTTAIQKLRG